MTHTPGKWDVVFGEADGMGEFAVYQGETGTICRGDSEMLNWKANAALIAAAPELLDALKKLVGWYDCFQLKEGEADLPVIVKSRAAIAKAENTTC